MAGVFNGDTNADYLLIQADINALPGYARTLYYDRLLQGICWMIDNSVALSSEELTEQRNVAKGEIYGGISVLPATDTLG